jgi:hypothetical protein
MAACEAERDAPSMKQPGTGSRRENRHVFEVTLLDAAGAQWHALGGGATVNEALAFAVASAPPGRNWRPVHWLELYGD